VNPRYSADHASKIYDTGNWFSPAKENLETFSRKDHSLTQHADKLHAKNVLKKIRSFIKQGTILDIGCGLGSFLDQARLTGYSVYGVEASSYAVDCCRQNGHTNIQHGLFTGTLYSPETFDCITAFDVFEHVIDPSLFLKDVYRIIKKGGLVVIQVPNVNCISARVKGQNWSQYILPEHLNYFNSLTLKAILTANQFQVVASFSEPSLSFGLRGYIAKSFPSSRFASKICQYITSFKANLFYPPVNYFFNKLRLEANLLSVYAIKQ
jgi:2-polyprenyl-3-methyl-5-hydroxy-6-metoxy-1,4-benzoquinol methylase